jgi:hypothetical protein
VIKPALYDVVEILYPLAEDNLPAGSQGTLVHELAGDIFQVEFVNDNGETTALCTLSSQQFIIVWQADTEHIVPIAEQVAQVVTLLPQQAGTEVLDFARFLSQRQAENSRSFQVAPTP